MEFVKQIHFPSFVDSRLHTYTHIYVYIVSCMYIWHNDTKVEENCSEKERGLAGAGRDGGQC